MNRGHNLFSVDILQIKSVLTDANPWVVHLTQELIGNIDRCVQRPIATNDDDIVEVRTLAKKVASLKKRLSQARLNDGRSFKRATKEVEAFFKPHERRMDDATKALRQRLTQINTKIAQHNAPTKCMADVSTGPNGESVITSAISNNIRNIDHRSGATMVREVSGYDLGQLDLNALKTCFTDYQIRCALNKHVRMNHGTALDGVAYTATAQL